MFRRVYKLIMFIFLTMMTTYGWIKKPESICDIRW